MIFTRPVGSSIQRPGKSAAPGRARQIGHRQHHEKKQRIQGHEAITRELKLIERRESPSDRRIYSLHLTKAGRDMLAEIGKVARQHQDDLCAALNEKERKLLAELLTRIVAQQNITPAVHPGYRQLGEASRS